GPGRVLASEIVSLDHGKAEWPVSLVRGWNRLRCSAPGESTKVFVLDVVLKSSLREWLETLLYALAFALLIRTFVLQVFVLRIDSLLRYRYLRAPRRRAADPRPPGPALPRQRQPRRQRQDHLLVGLPRVPRPPRPRLRRRAPLGPPVLDRLAMTRFRDLPIL